MNPKLSSNDNEQNLRIIRFFCGKLVQEDLVHEINDEKEKIMSNISQNILDIEDGFKKRADDIGEAYASRTLNIKRYMAFFGFITCIGLGFFIYTTNKDEFTSIMIGLLTTSIIAELFLFARLKQEKSKMKDEIRLAKNKVQDKIYNLKDERERELHELLKIINNLIYAWENARATKEEVFKYINNLIAGELGHKIGEFLDIQEAEIQDIQCAEVWTPTFMQCDQLPHPVEMDFEQSKKDIYSLRYEIIKPLKDIFPKNLSWDSFSYRILKKLNLADSNDLKLSAYNAVHYYSKEKAYLAGSYFYQKILCTEDFVSQFRCYVNVMCNRVAFTQAIQIHYADISAIGIEASCISEVLYDSAAIDKHVQTLSLELRSGSTYKMSGDAGSSIGKYEDNFTFYSDLKSKANETFETQIKNVRAFILENKGRKEAEMS